MGDLGLFTDGSVNTKSKVGFGAYLWVDYLKVAFGDYAKNVKLVKFTSTSSTKLELQTLLRALSEVEGMDGKLVVYTDSQNILSLARRRQRLAENNYRSKSGKLLNNYALYREYYDRMDRLDCEIIKVKGHKLARDKDEIDRLFTIVDRASRDALRKDIELP